MREWVEELWKELDEQPPEEQFVTTGEWIDYVTKVLLPELGDRRRDNVLELVDARGGKIPTVAAQLGVRGSTLTRLIDEGRARRKHKTAETTPVIEIPTVEQLQ